MLHDIIFVMIVSKLFAIPSSRFFMLTGDEHMSEERKRVYTYTRVSTAMQIDGYSLDAQKARMKAFADYNNYDIVGEYEDAGKSGKSIEGRLQFNQMMEDIKSGKDGVSFVLVFKLSRFGRNAADVLSTLQVMQDYDFVCQEMEEYWKKEFVVGKVFHF